MLEFISEERSKETNFQSMQNLYYLKKYSFTPCLSNSIYNHIFKFYKHNYVSVKFTKYYLITN